MKTEFVNSEEETDADVTADDGLENTDTSKNDSGRPKLGDLIDDTV